MRLRESDTKFCRDLEQGCCVYMEEYNQMSLDYNLSHKQRGHYLHNRLSMYALRFDLDQKLPLSVMYQQAINVISSECDSALRQARLKNHLNGMRVSNFVSAGMKIYVALSNVYKTILKLSRQCRPSRHRDAHRIVFLRQSFVRFS